jgi:hypothetical protein
MSLNHRRNQWTLDKTKLYGPWIMENAASVPGSLKQEFALLVLRRGTLKLNYFSTHDK